MITDYNENGTGTQLLARDVICTIFLKINIPLTQPGLFTECACRVAKVLNLLPVLKISVSKKIYYCNPGERSVLGVYNERDPTLLPP